MEIFFTDRTATAHVPDAGRLPQGALRAFAGFNVPVDMPFFLGSDGSYPRLLNQFLRDLPILGCPSSNTWRAYATDLQSLLAHLEVTNCPRGLLDLEFEDLRSYRDRRRNGEPAAVSAATWNRALAALQKFFDWAVARGHVDQTPFRYRNGMGRYGVARINSLHEREPADDDVKCVSLAHYRLFRSVGLAGTAADGKTQDPSFSGRNAQRNVAIADLLLSTGMRITECISILRAELPAPPRGVARSGAHRFRVAGHTAKRRRSRTVLIPSRQLTALACYADEDRADTVAVAGERGAYVPGRDWHLMQHCGGRKVRLLDTPDARPLPLDATDPALRRSLLVVDDLGRPTEPAVLFLNEDGLPMTDEAVRATFNRASERCTTLLGEEIDVTPHTLRHTFAVHMLSVLLREHMRVRDLATLRATRDRVGIDVFRELAINPLRILMSLLGHKTVETTYGYLTHIVDIGDVAGAAALAFDAELVDAPRLALDAERMAEEAANSPGDAQ